MLRLTRVAAMAALLPCRSRKSGADVWASACPGHGGQGLLAAERSSRSKHPPHTAGSQVGGGVFALYLSRRAAAGTGRASEAVVPALRPSRGRRRKPECVGDDGIGSAQHRGDQRRKVEVALAGGANDAGQHLLAVGAVTGAVATADLADNDGGTDGLFGAPVGGIDRQVPQEEKHGREFGGQMPGKALGVVQRWRCVNEPTEPGHESAADRCQTVLAQLAVVAAVTHGKARLQDPLHLPGPETVGMIFLQFLASSEQVIQAGLVQRGSVAAIRHPPVAHEHPVEVGPQNGGGIVEPAAGANGVDRRLLRLPRSRGRVNAFGFTSWHVLDERGFRVSIDDDGALWKCGNLAAPAQAWSAAIAREISNGLWAPASPTFEFSTTPTGRPQPGHFHSAPWGYAAQSGNAASVSATSGAERSSAAQQARVRFLDEPAGLAAAIRLTKPKASRAPVGHHSPPCVSRRSPVTTRVGAGDPGSNRLVGARKASTDRAPSTGPAA